MAEKQQPKLVLVKNEHSQWTDEQREDAYQFYRTDGGRSLRRTSELLGIHLRTLGYWSRVHGWQQRMLDDDGRDAELRHQTARMKLINELDPLIDNMVDLAYRAEKDKDRIDASKFLLQLMGYSPIQKIQQDIIDDRTTKKANISVREHKDLDLQALSDIVNQKALTGSDEIVDAQFTEAD
jgi:transposase-like protein